MLHVAVGVIVNSDHHILVAKRPDHVDHGGLWEFPGGKVESDEDVYAALCRELKEEVGLDVVVAKPLLKIEYDYDRYSVLLDTWIVSEFSGEAIGVEGQVVRWVPLKALEKLTMLSANRAIIASLNRDPLNATTG